MQLEDPEVMPIREKKSYKSIPEMIDAIGNASVLDDCPF